MLLFLVFSIFLEEDVNTAKHNHPVQCGQDTFCEFGATCASTDEYDVKGNLLSTCLCQIDCSQDAHRELSSPKDLLVCADDGNTYQSECHLRQQSCRTQKEMIVVGKGECTGNIRRHLVVLG